MGATTRYPGRAEGAGGRVGACERERHVRAEKLAVGFLGPYFGALDEHSGLPVAMQLEVLKRVRFVGPDEAPQPLWSVHPNLGVLQRMVNVTAQSGYFRDRAAQVWIVINGADRLRPNDDRWRHSTGDASVAFGSRERRPARRRWRVIDGVLRGAVRAS